MTADLDSLAAQELAALEELAALKARLGALKSRQNLPRILQWRERARPEQLPPEGNWRTWYVRGGRGCIAPETPVYLPLEDRHERIDVLAAAGGPVTVLALTPDGPAPVLTDGAPFAKGVARLYEVTTDSGAVITVTDQHRFLTPRGWLRLADMRAGQLLAEGVPVPPQAPSCAPSVSPSGVPRSTGTAAGCPDRCPTCPRCGDPLPHPAREGAPASPPSLGGAAARSSRSHQDDLAAGQVCNHPHPPRSLRARTHFVPAGPAGQAAAAPAGSASGGPPRLRSRIPQPSPGTTCPEREDPAAASHRPCDAAPQRSSPVSAQSSRSSPGYELPHVQAGAAPSGELPRLAGQVLSRTSLPARTAAAFPRTTAVAAFRAGGPLPPRQASAAALIQARRTPAPLPAGSLLTGTGQARPAAGPSPDLAYLDSIRWTRLRTVRPAGTGVFYDMRVPGPDNYLAAGLWHHNSGKTWTASHVFAEWLLTDREPGEWGICAPTYQDAWSVCIEGESGLLAALGTTYPEVRAGEAELVEHWHRSFAELRLRSGQIVRVASAEDGALHIQGKNLKGLWGDEVGLWDRWEIVWNESIRYAVRKGTARIILTGTPKKSRAARKLVRLLLDDPDVPVSRLRTADNEANLSPQFYAEVVGKSKGTRLERQELEGDLLADIEGALWTPEVIETTRVDRAPDLVRVVVAIDPAVTGKAGSDETGIIVAGDAGDGHGYVIADYSMRGTPDACMKKAVWAYKEHKADRIVGEANNGGDYLESLLRTVDTDVSYKKVIATRGKAIRAEPVSALYEQKRVHHVGVFPDLEDQLCTWAPTDSDSPDRLDALTWAFTELRGLSVGSWHEAYGTAICPSEKCGRGFMKSNPDGTPRTQCPHCRAPLDDDEAAGPEESAV